MMRFTLFNRTLLPGILAGSAVLASTACARPDRPERGSNNTSTVLQDSNSSTLPPRSNAPRAETAAPGESDAAGYRPMERDTGTTDVGVSTDTSSGIETAAADTAATPSGDVVLQTSTDSSTLADNAQADTEPIEILGNVASSDDMADETADEHVVNPADQEKVPRSDTAPVAPKDEVGEARKY